MQKIGILGAMREEITPILELFGVDFEEIPLGGMFSTKAFIMIRKSLSLIVRLARCIPL